MAKSFTNKGPGAGATHTLLGNNHTNASGVATSGHVLGFDGTIWRPTLDSAAAHTLLGAQHSDTTGTAISGHAFGFDGTNWRPVFAMPSGFLVPSGNYTTVEQGHALWETSGSAAALTHDGFSDFVGNEHVDHSAVTLTAGAGLTGGGTIAANRSFAVDYSAVAQSGSYAPSGNYVTVSQGHGLWEVSGSVAALMNTANVWGVEQTFSSGIRLGPGKWDDYASIDFDRGAVWDGALKLDFWQIGIPSTTPFTFGDNATARIYYNHNTSGFNIMNGAGDIYVQTQLGDIEFVVVSSGQGILFSSTLVTGGDVLTVQAASEGFTQNLQLWKRGVNTLLTVKNDGALSGNVGIYGSGLFYQGQDTDERYQASGIAGPTTFDGLTDTTIGTKASGHIASWNGTAWINADTAASVTPTYDTIYVRTLIAEFSFPGTFTSGAVHFSGIPQTYDHLEWKMSAKTSTGVATWGELLVVEINGDATVGNYDVAAHRHQADELADATHAAYNQKNTQNAGLITAGGVHGEMFANLTGRLDFYSQADRRKLWAVEGVFRNGDDVFARWNYVGHWNNAAAVTGLKFTPNDGETFTSGCIFQLFGWGSKQIVTSVV